MTDELALGTGLPQKSEERSPYSGLTERQMTTELLACLTLVAPTNFSDEDRAAWIGIARQTLAGMDSDAFLGGCQRARETCTFLSQVVPAILGNVTQDSKPSRYISATGYVYFGDEDAVIRESEKRADWDTHWKARAAKSRRTN